MKQLLTLAALLLVAVARAEDNRAGLDWWSLQAVRWPTPPTVQDKAWPRNAIDAFILARLEADKLRPAAPADKATLLRRATFDLTGLPPTPEEIDAFVADKRPDAWERVVARLLASPHYGERWGRHWLDLARFAESHGFEYDHLRDHAWRYRDYVVQSFNEDKPYPQFIREQLAGDVLLPASPGSATATGFLVAGPFDDVAMISASAAVKSRAREEELEDMIGTVAQTFLGLTLNCARCHDHKFDPIPQKDYYQFKAAFAAVRPGNRDLLTPDQRRKWDAAIAEAERDVAEAEKQIAALEQIGRAKALQASKAPAEAGPAPIARWTFQGDARDAVGALHGELLGGATVVGGRLRLDGRGAYLKSAPLTRPLREKTLEAWAAPAPGSRGGSVLTVEAKGGSVFDAIVFAEREAGKWVAGSEFYRRTRDLAAPVETAKAGELVHVAITYGTDNRIAVYRNGTLYGAAYEPTAADALLRTFAAAESHVLIGLRHTGGGSAFFAGEVAEARLYDRALTAAEVAASCRAGPEKVSPEAILQALTEEQRREHARLSAELLRRRAVRAAAAAPPPMAYATTLGATEPTHLLRRGDVEKPGERVGAAGLSAVRAPSPDLGLALDAPEGQRRLKLADWIASPENPLTARVLVNRVWQHHFGRGLVATPNDFGFSGDRPSHPELLDWLASEFVARGWSIKALHKLILLSATYQQGAAFNAAAAARDSECRLLWRYPPRRLEAEAARDAMLAVSGRLNPAVGGPSFRPFTLKVFGSNFYTLTDPDEPAFNRRGIYRMAVNSARDPLLEAFDCPDPSTKTPRRGVTTTPQQALGLMNNSFVLRQAKYLAARAGKEAGAEPAQQVARAYRLALGRAPTADETTQAVALAREHGFESVCWVLLNASEFLYVR